MIISNTETLGTNKEFEVMGVITHEHVSGTNVVKDMFAGMSDFFGGRNSSYENAISDAKKDALNAVIEKAKEAGADGITGLLFDVEFVGKNGTILMVSVTCTGVKLLK